VGRQLALASMVRGPDRRFVYDVERMEWEGRSPAPASAGLCMYVDQTTAARTRREACPSGGLVWFA
jgi:hypothetical protein